MKGRYGLFHHYSLPIHVFSWETLHGSEIHVEANVDDDTDISDPESFSFVV